MLSGNNIHWISPRVLFHQGFNCSYDRVYFEPDGTILKCYSWVKERTEMKPTDDVLSAIQEALSAPLLGFKTNIKGEEVPDYSPYVVVAWINYGLTDLQRAYFSEHTTDDYGCNTEIVNEFVVEPKHIDFVNALSKKANIPAEQTEGK